MAEAALTKRVIADSLKELCREKPFDKISVGEIAEKCNINRQTFYYHFQDKYDLLTWIYYEDFYNPSLTDLDFDNWDVCMEKLLTLVKENKAFSINTIKHAGTDMAGIFLRDTEIILGSAIDYIKKRPELSGRYLRSVDEEEQQFIARFFAFGVCGIIVEWVTTGMKEEPSLIASRMRILLDSTKQLAFKRVMSESADN